MLNQVGSGGDFRKKRGFGGRVQKKRPRDGAAWTTTAGLTKPSSLPRAAAPTTSLTDVRINRHRPYMRQRGPWCQIFQALRALWRDLGGARRSARAAIWQPGRSRSFGRSTRASGDDRAYADHAPADQAASNHDQAVPSCRREPYSPNATNRPCAVPWAAPASLGAGAA